VRICSTPILCVATARLQIELKLRYERQLRRQVRDGGKGIDLKFFGRSGHFELQGMRERVGGKFTVWAAPDSGTEIKLIIPAARTYAEFAECRAWFGEKPAERSSRSAL
jgi:nitrate/nitrite-specific signal transduction histidine kinase